MATPLYDNSSSASAISVTSLTYALTIAANSGRFLVVSSAIQFSGGELPSSVTYAGVSMTMLTSVNIGSTSDGQVSLWYLANPSSGTNNVVLTFPSATGRTSSGAISIYGVNANPIGASVTNHANASGGVISTNITTTATNSLLVDVTGLNEGYSNQSATATGANQTNRYSAEYAAANLGIVGSTETTTTIGTYTMSWSVTTSAESNGRILLEILAPMVFTRTPADSVMNGASRLTTIVRTSLSTRALTDSIMNSVGRLAIASRAQMRSLSDSVMNAAGRFATLVKGYLTTWTKETPPPTTVWTREQ